jgi:hypothetical protein
MVTNSRTHNIMLTKMAANGTHSAVEILLNYITIFEHTER